MRVVGRLAPSLLRESSGIVASRRHPGVFWTHNDGDDALLFAVTRDGADAATFRLEDVGLRDWEDIAIDADGLYVADIGNNDRKRNRLDVYRVAEPDPQQRQGKLSIERRWRLRFPAEPFDSESFFVDRSHGYLITKVPAGQRAELYRFALAGDGDRRELMLVTPLSIDTPISGADLSADGSRVGLVGAAGAYVYRCDGDFARLGAEQPFHVGTADPHIEGCCFVDDGLLATSENREIYLFTEPPFRSRG